ncbi:MAG: amidohydrolase [Flavobacteriales bacterium]|nr:amidohydrolase [Flavobacteriales bacterium]
MKLSPSILLATVLCSSGCAFQQEDADLVVHNAVIHTLGEGGSETSQAMAVRDGRIVELGAERQILNKYSAREKLDVAGQHVYPGFIDGHCHFLGYGLNKQKVDLAGAKSWAEVLERTVVFAKAHPEHEWILGRGWDQNLWDDKRFPDNTRLNELIPDRPVLLQRVDGHAAVVNEMALERVGLGAESVVAGGILELRDGRPTGLLVDNVVEVYQKIFDDAEEALKRSALLDAQRDCLAAGLTMVSDAGLDVNTIELIAQMQQEGALKIRIYAMVSDKQENLDHFAVKGPILSDRLIVRAVKCYADGALGSRGALLREPYSDVDSTWHGLLRSTPEHFADIATWCKGHGFQMATHCIGDSADRLLLGIYAMALGGTNDLRWRIEHAQCMDPADFDFFSRYTVIPSVQPTHATSDMLWADERLGPDRLAHAYAYKRLLKQNGMIALGTDFPVEGISPIATFYSAVVRKNSAGVPEGGFQMGDALSREEALYGITLWNAIASFTEKDLGSLEVGKFADFVILDRDLLTASAESLLGTRVMHTYVNGERMH